MRRIERVRSVGNLVNGSTAAGLLIARLGRARVRRGPRGLLLADGYRLAVPDASAFTVGDVLITTGSWRGRTASPLLRHEERHAWQWLACAGAPFLPLYLLGAAWSFALTGRVGPRNPFERAAGLADGGYPDPPLRLGLRRLLRRP